MEQDGSTKQPLQSCSRCCWHGVWHAMFCAATCTGQSGNLTGLWQPSSAARKSVVLQELNRQAKRQVALTAATGVAVRWGFGMFPDGGVR